MLDRLHVPVAARELDQRLVALRLRLARPDVVALAADEQQLAVRAQRARRRAGVDEHALRRRLGDPRGDDVGPVARRRGRRSRRGRGTASASRPPRRRRPECRARSRRGTARPRGPASRACARTPCRRPRPAGARARGRRRAGRTRPGRRSAPRRGRRTAAASSRRTSAGSPACAAASASRSISGRCQPALPYRYAGRRRKPHSMPSPASAGDVLLGPLHRLPVAARGVAAVREPQQRVRPPVLRGDLGRAVAGGAAGRPRAGRSRRPNGRRARARSAAVMPVMPAPTTATSTCVSPSSGGCSGRGSVVSSQSERCSPSISPLSLRRRCAARRLRNRPPARGVEARRVGAGVVADAGQQLEQRVARAVPRRPAELVRARAVLMIGTPSAMSTQPGGDGWSRSRQVTSEAARSRPGWTRLGRAPSSAAELVAVEHRVGRQVERAAHGRVDGEPERLADVERVHRLEAQALGLRHDGDQRAAHQRARQERTREQAPDLRRRLALEHQRRPHAHDAHLVVLDLEAVEDALDLGLVARVEGGLDAVRRPALVDRAVLRARASRRRPRTSTAARGRRPGAAASNTRRLPSTLVARTVSRSRDGWISHDRQTTASAPSMTRSRSSRVTSSACHCTFGSALSAGRRATATIEVTLASAVSAARTLVPMLPVAPITTTRMSLPFPA